MTKAARFVLSAYYTVALALPTLVFAQGAGLPRQIVPCSGAVAAGGLQACKVCDLATLAQNLINTGIFILVFLSAVLFAYAGFLYLTNAGNPSQASQAKSIFGHVAVGLIIILAAWLVVDTLMKSLLGGDFGPWNDICRVVDF